MNETECDERGLIVRCPNCARRNRLPYERLRQLPRCAQCGTALQLPGDPVAAATERAFEQLIQHASLPVLVDFWAPWCGPCKMAAPEVAKVATAGVGRWLVAKLNTEELAGPAQRQRVSAIPLFVLFHAGRELARQTGAAPAAMLQQFVERHLPKS